VYRIAPLAAMLGGVAILVGCAAPAQDAAGPTDEAGATLTMDAATMRKVDPCELLRETTRDLGTRTEPLSPSFWSSCESGFVSKDGSRFAMSIGIDDVPQGRAVNARTTDRRAAGLPVGELTNDPCEQWVVVAGTVGLAVEASADAGPGARDREATACSHVGRVLNDAATLLAMRPPLLDPGASLAGVDPCTLGDATIVREALGRDVAPRAGSLSGDNPLHACIWDVDNAWIQVELQPMNPSVWDRGRVEYLDLGGPGYTFRYLDAPGVCDLTYVHVTESRRHLTAAEAEYVEAEVVKVTSTAGTPESCAHDDNDPTKRFLRAVIQRLPPPVA
jgi:hypothetical protein